MPLILDNIIIEGLADTKSFRTQIITQDTVASTLTLTAASEFLTVFTGTVSGQIIKLPDATTIQAGHRYEFHNNSTAGIVTTDGSGATLNTATAGQRILAILQVAGTIAGTWSIVESEKISGQTSGAVTAQFNEFLLDVFHTHSGIVGLTLNGGTATMDTTALDNTYSGSFTLTTGTTVPSLTTMGKSYAYNNSGLTIKAAGQTIEWRMRLPVLSDSANATPGFDIKVGVQDTDLVGDPANGIYFQYSDNVNSGKWNCITRNSSTSTTINSNVTVAAATWYRLKFIVNNNGSAVDFYIDDNLIGTSIINIPVGNGTRLQVSIEKKAFKIQTFLPAAVNTTANTITIATHGFINTDRVVFTTTTTLPAPLSAATIYYVVGSATNTFQISTTSGGGAVNITSQGTGTHTVSQVSGTSSTVLFDWYIYSVIR